MRLIFRRYLFIVFPVDIYLHRVHDLSASDSDCAGSIKTPLRVCLCKQMTIQICLIKIFLYFLKPFNAISFHFGSTSSPCFMAKFIVSLRAKIAPANSNRTEHGEKQILHSTEK